MFFRVERACLLKTSDWSTAMSPTYIAWRIIASQAGSSQRQLPYLFQYRSSMYMPKNWGRLMTVIQAFAMPSTSFVEDWG